MKENIISKIPNIKYFANNKYNKLVSIFLEKKINESKNIVITGGKTILPIYKILLKRKIFYKKNFFLSDERVVTLNHSLSNFKKTRKYFLNPKNKNNYFFFDFSKINSFEYKNICKVFFKFKNELINHYPIELAILTIGKNCHIASIFFEKLRNKKQFFFKFKTSRVSIPINLLKKTRLTIFLCKKEKLAYELGCNFLEKKKIFKYFNLNKIIFLFNKKSYKVFMDKIKN